MGVGRGIQEQHEAGTQLSSKLNERSFSQTTPSVAGCVLHYNVKGQRPFDRQNIIHRNHHKITMYSEGNSAKLLGDIVNGTTQVTEGISAGMGLNLKSLLTGALGGKLVGEQPVQVVVTLQTPPTADAAQDATAASAPTPEQQV